MHQQEYRGAQSTVRVRLGIAKTASQLLDQWTALIDECEEGYPWDVSEYNQEMAARDHLGAILGASELQEFPEHRELAKSVEQADARFRALLIPDSSLPGQHLWWRAAVLRRAGPEYARYFRGAHGVDVEVAKV